MLQRLKRYIRNLAHLNRWVFKQSLLEKNIQDLSEIQIRKFETFLEYNSKLFADRETQLRNEFVELETLFKNEIKKNVKGEVARQIFYQATSMQQRIDQFILDHQSNLPPNNSSMKYFMDEYYVAFEEIFRGTRESIIDRYTKYLQFIDITSVQKALDVGCGRAEWVELLANRGIEAMGVDSNQVMVTSAENIGVNNIFCADAIDFLAGQADESFDMISAFHVIEHLPVVTILNFLQQAKRLLKTGGQLILETPNPGNLFVSTYTFYKDFTHLNPIPAEAISFMVSHAGFEKIEIIKTHPFPEEMKLTDSTQVARFVNEHFLGPQDYLLIAVKEL